MERYLYDLPIFDMIMTEENVGLYTISLVDNPAMEVNWYAFSKDTDADALNVKCGGILDEMERKVMVVICRADFPIIRKNEAGEFIYINFPKETIKIMAKRFLKNGYQGLVNLMHEQDTYVEGVEMEQLFIKDVEAGISPKQFEQIEDGSLFAIYKIENDEIWNDVLAGKYSSVSLEGLFTAVPHVEETKDEVISTIDELVEYLK